MSAAQLRSYDQKEGCVKHYATIKIVQDIQFWLKFTEPEKL